jgi:hypothetical protein
MGKYREKDRGVAIFVFFLPTFFTVDFFVADLRTNICSSLIMRRKTP